MLFHFHTDNGVSVEAMCGFMVHDGIVIHARTGVTTLELSSRIQRHSITAIVAVTSVPTCDHSDGLQQHY